MQSAGITSFLKRIPPELARSFNDDQLAAIELHFGMRYRTRHSIDWRSRIGLPFAKIYVVLLAGCERRPNP